MSSAPETVTLSSVALPPSSGGAAVDEEEDLRLYVPGCKRLSRDDVQNILDQFGVPPSSTASAKKRRAEASKTGSTEITFRAPITRQILSGLEDNLVFFLETFKERIARYEGYSSACTAYYKEYMTTVQNWQNGASPNAAEDSTTPPTTITYSKFSAASLRVRRPRIKLVRDWFLEGETHIPRADLPADQPESDEDEDEDNDDNDDAMPFDSSESSLLDVASDCDFPDTPFGETGLEVDVPEPTSPSMAPLPTFGMGPPLASLPTSGLSVGTAILVNTPEDAIANRLIRSIKGIPADFAALMRFVDIVQAEALELNTLLINIRDWVFLSLYAPDDVVFGGGGESTKTTSASNSKTNFSRTISRLAKNKSSGVGSSASAGLRTEMQIEIAESITEVLENRADTLESLREFKTLYLENRRNCLRAYAKFPIIPSYAQAFLANEEDAWRNAMDSFKTLRRVCATSFALVGRNLDSLRPCGGTKNKNSRKHALTSIYS